MKRTILLLVAAILTVSSLVSAATDVKKVDTATVPNPDMVKVVNVDGAVKNAHREFSYGDTCFIERGGTLTAIGTDSRLLGRILVRYSIDGSKTGTYCPAGVLFFVGVKTFSSMTAEYNRIMEGRHRLRAVEQLERDVVRRLTKDQ